MEFLSHTPPSFPDGSLKPSSFKRGRWGGRERAQSISGRLRSASDLVDDGVISGSEKGYLKDMIIANDPRVDEALKSASEGNFNPLQQVLSQAGKDRPRHSSIDLVADLGLEGLDLNFFDMGGSLPKGGGLGGSGGAGSTAGAGTAGAGGLGMGNAGGRGSNLGVGHDGGAGGGQSSGASHIPRNGHHDPSPVSSDSGDRNAQFQFDDDMFDYMMGGSDPSSSLGGVGGRGSDLSMGIGSVGAPGSLTMSSWQDGSSLARRQRLPSQTGSFSTFFGTTPPLDSSLDMYGNSPGSALAMSMEKPIADALSEGGPSSNKASGLSKMMQESENKGTGGEQSEAASKGSAAAGTAPRPIPRRAPPPVKIGPDGKPIKKMVGDYSPESRRARIAR